MPWDLVIIEWREDIRHRGPEDCRDAKQVYGLKVSTAHD